MNANLFAFEPPLRPGASPAPETLRLGMPQLALGGLSEGWLLRECGSRHWAGVAACFRVPPERLEDGRRHEFTRPRDGAALGVEMVTALLKRERTRDNTALSEADARHDGATAGDGARLESDLPALDKAVRGRQRQAAIERVDADARYRYRPLPQTDFNGAGLLYFASYPSMVDRAEWDFWPDPGALDLTTARREAFFFANLNPGDEVDVVLHRLSFGGGELSHAARLFRVSDGRLMAEIGTVKRRAR